MGGNGVSGGGCVNVPAFNLIFNGATFLNSSTLGFGGSFRGATDGGVSLGLLRK